MGGVSQSIAALLEAYQEQIEIYKQLLEKAEGERNLLEDGRLEDLVASLQQKQELISRIGQRDLEEHHAVLVEHFQTGVFSLPKMIKAATLRERFELEKLQTVLGELVAVLERLEEIEKENETRLRGYKNYISGVTSKQSQLKQAAKAYQQSKQMSELPEGKTSENKS